MTRRMIVRISTLSAAAVLAGCGGGHVSSPAPARTGAPVSASVAAPTAPATTPDSSAVQLGTALAKVEQDSAADQSALDSLHGHTADAPAARRTNQPLAGEDVRHEAEQLFGEGETATFDIDVTN